jgi:hypothetical protein
MVDRTGIRVADVDRQAAAEQLRGALNEGRLDLLEYDTRLAKAYAAVYFRDLDELFADLPASQAGALAGPHSAAGAGADPPRGVVAELPRALKVAWIVWLAAMGVALTAWLVVSLTTGASLEHFWPIWLLVPAAPLPGVTVGILARRRAGDDVRALPGRA